MSDRSAPHPFRRGENGQSVVMVVIFMVALLGMAAVAIDVGSWYQTKRRLQASADASALAGASVLPSGWSYASATASGNFAQNAGTGDTASYQNVTTLSSNDTVQVTASRTAPSYFAKLFGIDSANISATARATVKAYTNVISTGQVMPWGVMRQSWTPGTSYPIYTDNSSSNNGALSLRVMSGSSCSGTSGANDYRNSITGPSLGGAAVCPLALNQVVDTKSGNNAGPTRQGLDTRTGGIYESVSAIVTIGANGQATVLKPNSPQLIMVPVVENLSGGTTWPNGSSQVRVVGFAYFVVTGYTDNGRQVDGVFVGLQGVNTDWTTGAWNGSNNSSYAVEMTS